MRKLVTVLALLALAPFAFAACGGDDDDEEEPTTTTPTEEPTGGGGGGGGEPSTVAVTADPDGALAYEESSLEAPPGEITLELTNDASLGHDVCVESPDGEDLGCSDVVSGDSSSVTVDAAEPGDYTFYCSVDAHREAGMEGPLTVG